MTEIRDIDGIHRICHALANHNRIKLVLLLNDNKSRTLREIYDLSKEHIQLEHRETLYKYLETLVTADILTKTTEDSALKYRLSKEKITIDLKRKINP